jgi:hypothetical protein
VVCSSLSKTIKLTKEKKMAVKFENHTVATMTEEEVDGQVVERRLQFSLDGLDYEFVFRPPTDPPAEGATLVYVGDQERGRLSPSEYADDRAWHVASRMCY